jgi:hypothetical protein
MEEKVAASVYKTENVTVGMFRIDHATPFVCKKLALISPTGGSHSVGIVCSWTDATEFSLV